MQKYELYLVWFWDMVVCLVWDKVTTFECGKLSSFGYFKLSSLGYVKLSSFRYVKLFSLRYVKFSFDPNIFFCKYVFGLCRVVLSPRYEETSEGLSSVQTAVSTIIIISSFHDIKMIIVTMIAAKNSGGASIEA